jgi:hypothetical protein
VLKVFSFSCWWSILGATPALTFSTLFELSLLTQYLINIRLSSFKNSLWALLDTRNGLKNLNILAVKNLSFHNLKQEEFEKKRKKLIFQVKILRFFLSKFVAFVLVVIVFLV